jgi:phosphoglycerate dehydrogenase-like enzyme
MRENAVFINTGRGAQVVEDDLVRILRERDDLTALLDVTYPEPPVEGHPFYTLPNCLLSPHIAGSAGDEVARMGEYMLAECKTYLAGEPCKYEVTEKMLETMA